MRVKVRVSFLVILVGLLSLSACTESSKEARGQVHISVPYDLDTLDPHRKNSLSNFAIVSNFYESLATTDAGMQIVPGLARLWENPDQNTWIFHLHPNIRFHSGKKLTSADVVFSFERLLSQRNLEISGYLQGIEEVIALDETRVQIRTSRPNMVILNKIRFVLIVPAGSTVQDLQERVNGTGPYQLGVWKKRELVEMVRYDHYWRGKPDIQKAIFHLKRLPAQALADLGSGQFGLVQCNSRKLDAALQNVDRYHAQRADSLFLKFVSFDFFRDDTPFSSVQPNPFRIRLVREAINLGIDRRRLVSKLSTYATPATQLVPPFIFGYNPQIQLPQYDPAQARALLLQAGIESRLKVTLHARQMLDEAAGLVREQLQAIGIDAEVQAQPDKEFFETLDKRQMTLFLSRMGCTTGDVSDILDNSLHSIDSERHYGWHNYGGYSNPEIDTLIEASKEISLVEPRKRALQQIMTRLMEDFVWIPLYIDQDVYAVEKSLEWTPRNDSFLLAAEIRIKGKEAHP